MIKETYFPTSIYAENLNVDNEKLASSILKIKKEDPEGIYRSNVGDAYHSKQDLHLLPEFFEIRDLIFNTCLEIKKDWNKVQFKPAPGMVVIFPSYLPHQVFPNKSEEHRISMSFNIILKL